MDLLYFKLKTLPAPLHVLKEWYGAFDPTELIAKGKSAEEIASAEAEYDAALLSKGRSDPVTGSIAGIGYLTSQGEYSCPDGNEASLLSDFWDRYTRREGRLAGWDIMGNDLRWLKVRSWANGIEVPAEAVRRGGNGRETWYGFQDVKREFTGSPKVGANFNHVAQALGLAGNFVDSAATDDYWNTNDERGRALGADQLRLEIEQARGVAVRIGLERDPSKPREQSAFELEMKRLERDLCGAKEILPTYSDIETGPGDLAKIKAICGEFDPGNPEHVKYGNTKDPAKREAIATKARAEYDESLLKMSMLNPLFGRVSAIGYRKGYHGKSDIPDLKERELLVDFWDRWTKRDGPIAGWNFFDFDLPYIITRSWILGVEIPEGAFKPAGNGYRGYNGVRDLEVEFTGDPNKYMRLELAAKMFGHAGKNGEGAEFYTAWESADPAEHYKGWTYLDNDLDMTGIVGHNTGLEAPGVSAFRKPLLRPDDDVIPGLD